MGDTARNVWTALGLWALVWVVYFQVAGFGFIPFDDPAYTYHNPHVREGLSLSGLGGAFFAFHNGGWHPLTTLSQQLDVSLFGLVPGPMHLMNVFFHGLSVLLLFFVLLQATGRRAPALFAAALFAIHPMHVEPVAWIASRKDVLSVLFVLITLHSYTQYAARPSWKGYGLVTLALLAALLSKGTMVVLPLLLLLWDRWPLGRWEDRHDFWPHLIEKLPWLLLAVPVIAINALAQQSAGAIRSMEEFDLGARIANALVSLAAYLGQTVVPVGLSPFYPLPPEGHGAGLVLAAAGLLVVLVIVAWRSRRTQPAVTVGFCWFFVALLPVLNIAAIGDHARADRFVYLAHVGFFAGLSVVLWRLFPPRVFMILATLVVLALTPLAFRQATHWRDAERLFTHALAVHPENALAHLLLGQALDDAGQPEAALPHLEAAVALRPELREGWNSLGLVLGQLHRGDEALAAFDRELQHNPEHIMAQLNKANQLLALERIDEALRSYAAVIESQPEWADSHGNYGTALLMLGRHGEALPALERAVALDPAEPTWLINLAAAHWQRGHGDRAAGILEQALALSPGHPSALALQQRLTQPSPEAQP